MVSNTFVKLRGFKYATCNFVVLESLYRGFGIALTWFWIHSTQKQFNYPRFFNNLRNFQNPVTQEHNT